MHVRQVRPRDSASPSAVYSPPRAHAPGWRAPAARRSPAVARPAPTGVHGFRPSEMLAWADQLKPAALVRSPAVEKRGRPAPAVAAPRTAQRGAHLMLWPAAAGAA